MQGFASLVERQPELIPLVADDGLMDLLFELMTN
jgi:hypothetical protein